MNLHQTLIKMILINRMQNDQCLVIRMAGSFKMLQEDWTKRKKKEEQHNENLLKLKTTKNE